MKRLLTGAFCLFVLVMGVAVTQVNFNKLRDRDVNMELSENIKHMVVANTMNMNAIEIAHYCNRLTCSFFTYSTSVCVTPELKDSKGHCVTYSTVCKELCNLAYKAHNIDATAKVVVGESAVSCARVACRCNYIKLRAHTIPLWVDVISSASLFRKEKSLSLEYGYHSDISP